MAAPFEDGEIPEDVSGKKHHPAFEWAGNGSSWTPEQLSAFQDGYREHPTAYSEDQVRVVFDASPAGPSSSSAHSSAAATPSLRLIRVSSTINSVLPRSQTLAIVDGYSELQFGRDVAPPGTTTPRLRLKEMEVSKLHATVYWDAAMRSWAVVDMGSKHGTFVMSHQDVANSSNTAPADDPRGSRLSAPRMSSVPRRLGHLDRLSIGSTSFVVHIHDDQLPCEECTATSNNEIPLHASGSTTKKDADRKRKRDTFDSPPTASPGDPKKALTMLKRNLLLRHHPSSTPLNTGGTSGSYLDRSARRRALYPTSPDAPGVPSSTITTDYTSIPMSRSAAPAIPPPISDTPSPLPPSNIGHRLLMKQGWTPGTALRTAEPSEEDEGASTALVDPIQVNVRMARSGIGVQSTSETPPQTSSASWKDDGKFRRWSSLK